MRIPCHDIVVACVVITWTVVSSIVCKASVFQEYSSLGCWKEDLTHTSNRAIPDLQTNQSEGDNQSTTGAPNIVSHCAHLAKAYGYSYFGVRDHQYCVSDTHAGLTYNKYGPSSLCRNGTGGPGAINVYSFEGSSQNQDDDDNPTTNQILPSQDRSKIELRPLAVNTQGVVARDSLLPGARTSSLFVNGNVQPVSIEPLFEEIDELKYGDYIPVPIGQNFLNNPSFELPLNPSPLDGWSCQGETDDPRGGAISRYSKDRHGSGRYSGICYARLSEWAGPGQYIGRKVKPLSVYSFIGWTRLLDRKNTNDIHSMELWLRMKKRDQKNEIIMRLARRDKLSEDHGWVRWKASFQMPASPGGFRYVFIFFRGPHRLVDIIADDMKLVEVFQDPNWKEKTDKLIEKYRKRPVRLRINVPEHVAVRQDLSLTKIKVEQTKHRFGFGAAVNTHSLINNKKYRDFLLTHFEWAVMESSMKWKETEKIKDRIDYEPVDKALAILEKHNITLRGHCIYWAVPDQLPGWLIKLPKRQLFARMKQRMEGLLGRYNGRFVHWDVNNEMLHGRFFADRFGKSIREWMFKRAAQLDADADLFINDFDVVENNQLTEVLVEQVKEFIDRGVDIDGIGVQGHFTGSINPFLLRLRLNALADVARPIWLTEVDILDKNTAKRADSLEALMRMTFSHPNVHGIMFWAFWNLNSWRGPDVALVNGWDWKLNAAGQRYVKLLDQWTTRGTLSPATIDNHGAEAGFSGFHGNYDLTVTLPWGDVIKKQFTLEPGYDEFIFNIDVGDHVYQTSPPQEAQSFTQQLSYITSQLSKLLLNQEPDQRLPDEGVTEEEAIG